MQEYKNSAFLRNSVKIIRPALLILNLPPADDHRIMSRSEDGDHEQDDMRAAHHS